MKRKKNTNGKTELRKGKLKLGKGIQDEGKKNKAMEGKVKFEKEK